MWRAFPFCTGQTEGGQRSYYNRGREDTFQDTEVLHYTADENKIKRVNYGSPPHPHQKQIPTRNLPEL